ncbi:sensor histidine kinase [Subsaximicrobium wynnwilliamsii]|uniref:Sensor histidine kinase n=1 Tax=Subsaximicrobium wynnwilliamsii TaxID=291179 RepID=A0A5C6Z9X3_9FLAO|nr:histidine kinase [Subsaximicrobium wynnwilliamsii]TXD80937.1 sensor histidine kinase [Subsaximicrobium wynnwilliamsii]TXD86626.1 sensor histidine kinase [Subsaximicrobium wynnwilliamsii]TXE00228.1 sensor histidine kinase [Subsaximicrobium wynnwilliamsii]
MDLDKKIVRVLNNKETKLFVLFYIVSAFIYYTATWISWGTYKKGFLSYFDVEEFFAAAGTQFMVSFLITIPIWYVTEVILREYTLKVRLLSHVFFLPIFILACYFGQLGVTKLFGWAMFWGGKYIVWTLYNLMLFYLVQFGFIHAYNYWIKLKNEELEKSELRELALKSEMTAMKAQLTPHFLHNLFNSINATIPPENERTRELIVQLSDLFRYLNYASQHEYVTIQEELSFIENYLQLMKIRLKERLKYSFEVPNHLKEYKIAPMLFQPIVENAVIHGISPKIEPSTLIVRIKKSSEKLLISIEDTGLGILDKENLFQKGLGLSNTKLRLNKIYDSDLKIDDNIPLGTIISFEI